MEFVGASLKSLNFKKSLSLKFLKVIRGYVAALRLLCVRDVQCGEVCWTLVQHTSPHHTIDF